MPTTHASEPIPDPAAGMERTKELTRRLLTVPKKALDKSLAKERSAETEIIAMANSLRCQCPRCGYRPTRNELYQISKPDAYPKAGYPYFPCPGCGTELRLRRYDLYIRIIIFGIPLVGCFLAPWLFDALRPYAALFWITGMLMCVLSWAVEPYICPLEIAPPAQ